MHRLLDRGARVAPGEEIVTVTANGTRRQTYAQLRDRSHQLAHALRDAGIEVGDRVGTFMWNGSRHLEAYYATAGMAAVVLIGAAGTAQAGKDLDAIKARGALVCGVGTGTAGFMLADSQGKWTGLDVLGLLQLLVRTAHRHPSIANSKDDGLTEPDVGRKGAAGQNAPACHTFVVCHTLVVPRPGYWSRPRSRRTLSASRLWFVVR
jgi:non-ribosomal peptide synthetase component E (peptide arylation enzyme)